MSVSYDSISTVRFRQVQQTMKYSSKDSILALISITQLFIIFIVFFYPLSSLQILAAALATTLLIGTNYQCISHNFIHTPFFKSNNLNNAFSILNSLCLGLPQSVYREHHMNHHRFNNDPLKDDSSLYKFGNAGKEEGVLSYCLIGVFRTDLKSLFLRARKTSGKLVLFELVAVLIFFLLLLKTSPTLFVVFYISTWYFGQVFALLENYAEHHGAKLHDRQRDSVSCYNRIYNLIWFNNGFHQEHHFRPMVHWTEIRKVKDELPSDRKTTKYFHLSNLG
jgi:fatty acid desaturase